MVACNLITHSDPMLKYIINITECSTFTVDISIYQLVSLA